MRKVCLVLFMLGFLAGCLGERQFPAPPSDRYTLAKIPGFPNARFWGDVPPPRAAEELALLSQQIGQRIRDEGKQPNGGRIDILVLSGGGSDGAYGAGLLNGWTARGDRPEFGLVTGISTGALIAPYAFVGKRFDPELERFYTNTKTEDVLVLTLFKTLTGQALGLADNAGFVAAVDQGLTPQLIRDIAAEHRKGRRLWVGTTNLDAQRPVIWNISAIAATGRPEARELIRDVLVASASIPGAFSPQLIEVEIDGQRFTEMHVDGGVSRQLFLYPIELDLGEYTDRGPNQMRPGTIYVIRNTLLDPTYEGVPPRVLEITARSVSTLIKYSGVADVEIIRAQALDDGFGLKLTAVPPEFTAKETELFDPAYMRALYDVGYGLMVDGNPWTEAVPRVP